MGELAAGNGLARRSARVRRYIPMALTVGVGVMLSVVAFTVVRNWERERVQAEFERQARAQAAAVLRVLDSHVDVLQSIAGVYVASREVERHEFRDLVGLVKPGHPGIQALEWVPRVRDAERAAYEATARKDGHRRFQITELNDEGQLVGAPPRPEYFPIYYVEPIAGNENALGFDLASQPTRREALERARDTGVTVATGRIRLLQEASEQFGFMMFLPIYRRGAPKATPEERRQNLSGFGLGVFRVADIVETALKDFPQEGIDIHIYDALAPPDEGFLYVHPSRARQVLPRPLEVEAGRERAGPHWATTLDIAGRRWSLLFRPSPEFLGAQYTLQPWGVLGGGLLITALLGMYMFTVSGRTAQVERLVAVRTAELEEANRELEARIIERKRADDALRESEERYRDLVEHSEDLILTHDLKGRILSANGALARCFGYERAEELLGRRISDYLAPDVRHLFEPYLDTVMKQGHAQGIMKVVTPSRGERILEYQNSLRTEGVETPIVRGRSHDVTERIHAERALARRTKQLQALRAVSMEMTRELDLATLLGMIVRQAAELLGARSGAIYLWDETTESLSAPAWLGLGEWMREVRLKRGQGIAGTVVQRREGMIVNNYRTSPHAGAIFLDRTRFTAVVAEPILYHDRLVGVVAINNEGTGQRFNEWDREILALFAAQAAVAIVNARLYTEAQHRAERIAVINRLTKVINSSLNLGAIYQTFAKEVQLLIPYDRMGVAVPDISGSGLVINQLATDRRTEAGMGSVWSNRAGTAIEWVMSHRKPLITRDLTEEQLFAENDFLLKEGIRSSIRLPLIVKGDVIGVFFLDSTTPDFYANDDLDFLVPLGEQLGLAMENARLYSALEESKSKLEELYRLGLVMQEPMSLMERLDLVLKGAQTVLGFDRINILLPDPDKRMLRAVASVGVEEPLERIHVPLGPEGGGIAKAFLECRELVWEGVERVPDEWRLAPPYSEIAAFRSKAFVNVPLIVRGEAIGILGADNKFSQKPISKDTVRLLKIFAAQAALAIDNARLHDEVTGYAKNLEQKVEQRTKALKETQVQLVQSGKLAAVGTLAAGVAHELNQPLMVIRGYAQELIGDPRLADEELREDVRRIESQTTRMVAIISHLRDFSRQSKGKRQIIDLNHVVTHAFTFLGQQLKAGNIDMVQQLDPALPPVWADALQIEQVLLNLVTNARDAMEAAGTGTIIIRTGSTGDGRVALSVTDTGPGISPDLQTRIFDPFFTTKEVGKGTGLGLSICHGIVEEHGGELLLRSPVADGRGARFTIALPISLRDAVRGDRA